MQIDYVHSRGHNEPMTPQINYFEDPVTHLPQSPARYGRPFPAFTNITMTSTGKSAPDGPNRANMARSPSATRLREAFRLWADAKQVRVSLRQSNLVAELRQSAKDARNC